MYGIKLEKGERKKRIERRRKKKRETKKIPKKRLKLRCAQFLSLSRNVADFEQYNLKIDD